MSFQFNFTIGETESRSAECELHEDSPNLINKEENSEANKLPLGDEVQTGTTDNVKETELMTSSCKTNTFNSGNRSHDCLAEEKALATEHKPPEDVSKALENKIVESISGLHFVNVSVVEMTLSEGDSYSENIVNRTVTSKSDLISGVYEGGMKIWECTFDLIKYLEDHDIDLEGKSVLDLGCGAGLLGILALKRKAKEVHFQDYNSTVIGEITLPNALANCDIDEFSECSEEEHSLKRQRKSKSKAGLLSKCRFFSGEWSQFMRLMQNEVPPKKYDIILTSETIYNPDYYNALHDVFQNLLAKNGTVYLATKSHYFGVGGGVHVFETFVKKKEVFCIKTLKVYDDGLQRQLLSLFHENKVC
ncbi:histidine protein methyltransferase 1 homolog isoform X2 [Spea bombifrons]|uniref:histidine protein methyltransferase 1 homolog isoform X2 n=1 Tax=Spea bombifrons TaxID=233779 RepID=UPI002349FEC6|nr:histidine protein methyltransferase 1 homolog isoform X2 [Spea bombifrons]